MVKREIKIKTANFPYRIVIDTGILAGLGRNLRLLFPSTRAFLVSDTTVYNLYGETVKQSLADQGWQVTVELLSPGEGSKSLENTALLYDRMIEAELDRNSPVIALGGGVVGDLAGFAAATYLRGVPLVMVPTTLLAQVDSSVGGKVAVNHHRGKNLIGSIYPPRLVIVDPETLQTLPVRQLKAGLAETVKYGIITDPNFFSWLEKNIQELLNININLLTDAVMVSVMNKARVVEADEFEKDYRRVLNFGHTIGHALEAATAYQHYLHGEAVLSGMFAAVDLALKLKFLSTEDAGRIERLLWRIGRKKAPADLTAEAVIDKLRQDKKRLEGEIFFVLPKTIGSAEIMPVSDHDLILEAVKTVLDK